MEDRIEPKLESTKKIIAQYKKESKQPKAMGERFGQFFCNRWIKQPWPELYYQENYESAVAMIEQWLSDKCYWASVPPRLKT